MGDKVKRKPTYTVTLVVEASRLETVDKQARAAFGDAVRSVRKVDMKTSRADRLGEIESGRDELVGQVEELRDEMQEWYDNMPENFQSGDKGSEVQQAVDELENIVSGLNDVDFGSVEFPGMY